jgi:hypothetical protein
MGEYIRFMRRIERDLEGTLLFLSVLGKLSEEKRYATGDLKYICQTYQYVEFHPRLVDGLTALLITVERALQRKKAGSRLR